MNTSRTLGRFPFRLGLLAMFLLGACLSGLWVMWTRSQEPSMKSPDMNGLIPQIGNPDDPSVPLLSDGRLVDLPTAAAQATFPLPRPDTGVANDSMISQVWIDPTQVAIRYASGLRVYIDNWPPGSYPAAFYSTVVEDMGAGRVVSIKGSSAWIVAKDEKAPGSPPDATVDVTVGRMHIGLQGPVSLDDVVAAASSLHS
jgi:hypothetical protein